MVLKVFILAASSLHHAIKTTPEVTQNCYNHNVYALPGLSFNPNAVKVRAVPVESFLP